MSNLLINESPLQVLPSLAKAIGLNEAIVLQQVHYWLKINEKAKKHKTHFRKGRWWVFNTQENWVEDNFPWWSVHIVGRILRSLRDKNLLLVDRFNRVKYDRTIWYSINYDELSKIEKSKDNCKDKDTNLQKYRMDNAESESPIPETTTETTTEEEIVSQSLGAEPQELEYIPEGKEFEKPKRKPTGRNAIKADLSQYFSELTGIPILPIKSKRDASARSIRWWKPLMLIYDSVGEDIEQAREIVQKVYTELIDNGMTVAAPQSILNNALAEIGKRNKARMNGGKRVIRIGE